MPVVSNEDAFEHLEDWQICVAAGQALRAAATRDERAAFGPQGLQELFYDRRLADAGLAGDGEQQRTACRGVSERLPITVRPRRWPTCGDHTTQLQTAARDTRRRIQQRRPHVGRARPLVGIPASIRMITSSNAGGTDGLTWWGGGAWVSSARATLASDRALDLRGNGWRPDAS
jgi:hypothetical protein